MDESSKAQNNIIFAWAGRQLLYQEALNLLISYLTEIDVPFLPVKGAYLIQSGKAALLKNREMKDIDIIVRQEDYTKVISFLLKQKQAKQLGGYWYFEEEIAINCLSLWVQIDIHYLLNFPSRFYISTDELFQRSLGDSKIYRMLSPEDALLCTICHSLVHFAHDNKELPFDDITVMIQDKDFYWHRFWDLAKKTGVKNFIAYVITLCKIKRNITIPNLPKLSFYTRMLLKIPLSSIYKLPLIARRLLLEIPFVRNPFFLLFERSIRKFTKKKMI